MIKLIVGLANFSCKYFKTRHSIGAWYIKKLMIYCNQYNLKKEDRFYGYTGKIFSYNHDIRLLIPATYMNMSGKSVLSVAKFYQLSFDEILIVHDELDLSPGQVKLKFSGGHNGHKGIKDIIQKLNSQDFYRLRIGIGRPSKKDEISRFVLSEPSSYEKEQIDQILLKIIYCTEMIIIKKFSRFIQCINTF